MTKADNRDRIARKMRALAAKTVENGCTEEEALAAAELLSRLMEEYDLTLDEATLREQRFEQREARRPRFDDLTFDVLWRPGVAIAELTHTRTWISSDEQSIQFFGFEHEVAIAQYLAKICYYAMRSASERHVRFYALDARSRKQRVFLHGMSTRLAQRIRDMIKRAPPGKGLIVLHNQLIDEELANLGIKLTDKKSRIGDIDAPSFAEGYAAGADVALNPGIKGPDGSEIRRLT